MASEPEEDMVAVLEQNDVEEQQHQHKQHANLDLGREAELKLANTRRTNTTGGIAHRHAVDDVSVVDSAFSTMKSIIAGM